MWKLAVRRMGQAFRETIECSHRNCFAKPMAAATSGIAFAAL
jgi:hypothetical protein